MKKYILSIILFTATLFAGLPVFAEGSKDLYPDGASGSRTYLRASTSETAAFPFANLGTHFVYAKAGETIAIATDAQKSTSKRIFLYSPTGADVTPTGDSSPDATRGNIPNRAAEKVGPRLPDVTSGSGYTPIYYTVPANGEGIYKVEFRGGNGNTTGDARYSATATGQKADEWPSLANNNYLVAWDISVANTSKTAWISGRVYTNVLNMDDPSYNSNKSIEFATNSGFYGKFKVLTRDGYVYNVNNNGMQGISFTFMVNNRGFHAVGDPNTPSYKSISASSATDVQNRYHNPNTADAEAAVTHKIFYNLPDKNMPAEATGGRPKQGGTTTWLRPDQENLNVTAMTVEGVDGTLSQISNKGGYIKFANNSGGDYTIRIAPDIDNDDYVATMNFVPRTLTGTSVPGENNIYFDGKDGDGVLLPQGNIPVQITIKLRGAEVHFPYIDMELNKGGIIIELLEEDYSAVVADKVYWDDRGIGNGGGNAGSKSSPINASHTAIPNGTSSNENGHKWGGTSIATSGTFGDNQGMDTWTFIEGDAYTQAYGVVHKIADLYIDSVANDKDPNDPIYIGDEITYTVVAGNKEGSCPVEGAPFSFILPPGFVYEGDLNDVKFTPTGDCGSQSDLSYDSATGTFKSKLNLGGSCDATGEDCKVTYTFKVKVTDQASSANTTATATIMRPNDVDDPDATNTSDPTNPLAPEGADVDLDAYYYLPTDPFFEIEHNGKDGVSNNIKDNQIPNFIDDIRADNDINQTPVNVPVSGNVLTNDYSSNGVLNVGSAKYYDNNGTLQTLTLDTETTIYTEDGSTEAGKITLNSNGSYTFTPATGFVGDVPVEYTAINGTTTATSNNNDDARLTITVIPATVPGNNPPIALDDVATTKKGVTLTGDILANDSDPDGNSLTVTEAIQGSTTITVGTPTQVSGKDNNGQVVDNAGSITINANGKIEFVPNGDFVGTVDPIEYTISDGEGGTDKANIYITVIDDHGNTTFANDDANTAPKDASMIGNVLTNDFDPEGDIQTLTAVKFADGTPINIGVETIIPVGNPGAGGKITFQSDGSYTYTPAEGFVGTVVVEQTVCDNGTPVACDNATLYLTTLPESDNTTNAVDDFFETGNNTPITGNVMDNDYDNEGDTQRVTTAGTITTTEGGIVIIDEDGNFTYTPPADKNGIFDTFEYKVCDNGTPGACDVAEVIIAVGICYEEVGGKSFYWHYSDDGDTGVATETITQPVANYGFTFDIYELDNSFNMNINGVQLAVDEIEFQSNGTSGINIMFADGDKYETNTYKEDGTTKADIWEMKGNAANPLIRVVISHTGKVTMYGSKVSYGPLFPLKFIEEKGNEFNPIDFSNAGGENNVIEVTQNRVGVTIMDGKGYGRNMVDCPNYWYGYDDNDWAENSNWTDNYVPKAYEDIVFATEDNNRGIIQGMSGPGAGKGAADKDLYLDSENHNYKDTNEPSGGRIIKDLINQSNKDLVVTTTNQLIIDGKVHDDNTGIIVVKADEEKAIGTLIFKDPDNNQNVAAKVEFINLADECADCGFYKRNWQYFGIPVDGGAFPFNNPLLDGEMVRRWDEPTNGDKWLDITAASPVEEMTPFMGYEITSKETAPKYEFEGTLNVGDKNIVLSKTPGVNYSGMNLLANSYTAAIPIELAAIELGSSLAENTVYLFNRGTRDQWRKTNGGSVPGTAGGQYTAVPVELAGQATLPDRILSMHSFMVNAASDGTQITLKYDQLVKNEAGAGQPAWRSADNNGKRQLPYIVLDVIGEGSADRVWLFEESSTTRGYDNGWDGHKMLEGDLIQVFATDADQNKYQVTTVPQFDDITVGIAARENESYTISVSTAADVENRRLYLHDTFTGRGYLLKDGAEIIIPGTRSANQNRFKITASNLPAAMTEASTINTYVRDNVIVVENRSGENATVSVYDISGRFVGKAQIAKDEMKSFPELSIAAGVKVVKVVSDSGAVNCSDRVLLK